MTIEWNDLLGMGAGALTAASRVPQIVKTWKTRTAGGLSLTMYAMLCTGFLLWLTYGIMTESIPIVLSNLVSLGFNAVLLVFRFRFGEST
ncbi:MAG: SemiSWEET transporter [Cytophagales bacterium]|nr:SemiSWEET transporter [Cytophagales bacterium]